MPPEKEQLPVQQGFDFRVPVQLENGEIVYPATSGSSLAIQHKLPLSFEDEKKEDSDKPDKTQKYFNGEY